MNPYEDLPLDVQEMMAEDDARQGESESEKLTEELAEFWGVPPCSATRAVLREQWRWFFGKE